MTISVCSEWDETPGNAYLKDPAGTPLCPSNKTFCESNVLSMKCMDRATCNIPGNTLGSAFTDPTWRTANVQFERTEINTASEVRYFVEEQIPFQFANAGLDMAGAYFLPVDPGDLNLTRDLFSQNPNATHEFWVDDYVRKATVPPVLEKNTRSAPQFLVPTNVSCVESFDMHVDEYIELNSEFVLSELDHYINSDSKGVVATAYLPFGTGKVVAMMYCLKIKQDGSVLTTEDIVVRDIEVDSPSAARLALLAVLVIGLSFLETVWVVNDLVARLFDSDSMQKSARRLLGEERASSRWLRPEFVAMVLHAANLLAVSYCLFKFDQGFTHVFWDGFGDRVRGANAIMIYYYVSILLQELGEVLVTKDIAGYLMNGWNVLDLFVVVFGFAASAVLSETAQVTGQIDRLVNNYAFPPFNAFREESTIYLCNASRIVNLLTGALGFFLMARLFKFLAISPVLLVPFAALRRSLTEIAAFATTLVLFTNCFGMFFSKSYGAEMPAFSEGTVFETLFQAALDDFPDEVYDRLQEYRDWRRPVGIISILIFKGAITVSFMNMLITITMEWYGRERSKPGASRFLSESTAERIRHFTGHVWVATAKLLAASSEPARANTEASWRPSVVSRMTRTRPSIVTHGVEDDAPITGAIELRQLGDHRDHHHHHQRAAAPPLDEGSRARLVQLDEAVQHMRHENAELKRFLKAENDDIKLMVATLLERVAPAVAPVAQTLPTRARHANPPFPPVPPSPASPKTPFSTAPQAPHPAASMRSLSPTTTQSRRRPLVRPPRTTPQADTRTVQLNLETEPAATSAPQDGGGEGKAT